MFKKPFIAILFSTAAFGLLCTLSLAPFNWPVTAWIAPWALFAAAKKYRNSVWKLFGYGLLAAFFLCLFSFYWTVYLFIVFGGIPAPIAVFMFIPYTFLLNLKIPLFLVFLGLSHRRKFRKVRYLFRSWIFVGILAVLFDMFTPQVFNWYWGNLIAGNDFIVQVSDLTGVYGLTFLHFAGSYIAYRVLFPLLKRPFSFLPVLWGYLSARNSRYYLYKAVMVPFALFIIVYVYGVIQKYRYENLQKDLPVVRVLSVQPNSPLSRAGEGRVSEKIIHRIVTQTIPELTHRAHVELAEKSDEPVDIIVLPESSVPYFTTQKSMVTDRLGVYRTYYDEMIVRLSEMYGAEVFFNQNAYGIGQDPLTGKPRLDVYNSSSLFDARGKEKAVYHKQKLIAFGEQIPYADFLDRTGLIALVPEAVRYSRFRPGSYANLIPYTRNDQKPSAALKDSPGPVRVENDEEKLRQLRMELFQDPSRNRNTSGYFMPLICYEVLAPEIVSRFFDDNTENPDFMVNITQDRWYGKTIETFQHYELGRLRAVEFRRALVRSTNSGSSGYVDLAGNYVEPLVGPVFTGQETEAVQVWDVPVYRETRTVYARAGDYWIWALLLIWIFRYKRK